MLDGAQSPAKADEDERRCVREREDLVAEWVSLVTIAKAELDP